MKYEVVIGLEVHVELSTKTKLFCSCSTEFGAQANQNVCPSCLGMPGTPALLNKKAVELGIAAGLLTNCEISKVITFDKKNYFYPDLPSGYQLTQLYAPICTDGKVNIHTQNGQKTITLKQIHLECDAGKLIHDGFTSATLVDYNRAGVPLVEIVSNPDFSDAEEVVAYLEKIRSLFSFAGVSDCKMQEGSMRCDINLSIREQGSDTLGTRTEIKNMNSLKAISAAIEYEAQRQIDALESGEEIVQETRRWDDASESTFSMRGKEDATDYRYCPDPEILPTFISPEMIQGVKDSLPESAEDKYKRMTTELGLSDYDSSIITGSKRLSDIFDETLSYFNKPKEVVNWIISELLAIAKGDNKGEDDIYINCQKFARLLQMVEDKVINRTVAKKILLLILEEEVDPESYVQEHNLAMVSDTSVVSDAVKEVLEQNQRQVEDYKNGNQKIYGYLVGQTMKMLRGKADPQLINRLLKEYLGEDE